MISRLHYITQDHPTRTHQELALAAMQGGVKWVQVRVKNRSDAEVKKIASDIFHIAQEFGAKVILNDYVALAKAIGLDGVHVGKQDTDPVTARKMLGEGRIVGGTANTWEDVLKLHLSGVDYIGLGPFRFTNTKDQLSPVLGHEGYKNIIALCKYNQITTPLIAIGGIGLEDVGFLRKDGIFGVAIAAAIGYASVPAIVASRFVEEVNSDLSIHKE